MRAETEREGREEKEKKTGHEKEAREGGQGARVEGTERRDNRGTFNGSKKKNVEETRQTVRGRDKREIIRGDVYQTCGEGSGKKSRDHVKADGGRTRQKRTHEGKQDR